MSAAHLYGDRAILLTDLPAAPTQLTAALTAVLPTAAVRPGLDTILVTYPTPDISHLAATLEALERVTSRPDGPASISPATHLIPVRYTGEDLATAAHAVGLSVNELITAHSNAIWTVALLGFAPGFPYLVTDAAGPAAPLLDLPRRDTPRTRVPAGSVALAAGMSAIYPEAMPGGWHLLGTTETTLFNPQASPPALLAPGDQIQFTQVTP